MLEADGYLGRKGAVWVLDVNPINFRKCECSVKTYVPLVGSVAMRRGGLVFAKARERVEVGLRPLPAASQLVCIATISPIEMLENRSDLDDLPQASEPGQGELLSAFLQNAKLRTKLEKLARWRIDPSRIEIPTNAREFRGGYATVSQAFLAYASNDSGGAKESEHPTDERPDSNARNLQSHNDKQEYENEQKFKGEQVASRGADGSDDDTQAEADKKRNGNEGPQPHHQSPPPKVGDTSSYSDCIADKGPYWVNHDLQSPSDIQKPQGDDPEGQDEEIESRVAEEDDHETKEEGRKRSENTSEEQSSDRRGPKPKITVAVAVKKLKAEKDTDLERALGLALRESEFLVELSHPNIVRLEGFVEDLSERKVWLVFPWEEHGNLRDFLASGEWEIPERISLINDVTLGLEYLHNQEPPIYHGDLKSLNILVNSKYHALITDFGSARHLENDHGGRTPKQTRDNPQSAGDPSAAEEFITLEALFSDTASTLSLTRSSYTIRWAAPELLQDDEPCLGSDIWALGWIAYEVMTNTIPFHDVKKDAIVINRVVQGHLPSITEDARMSLIRALCSLMVQCWKIDPTERPTAEGCQKLVSWMPMIVPAPTESIDEDTPSTRSAQLLNRLGQMYKRQGDYVNAFNCFTKASTIYTASNDRHGKAYNLRSLAGLHLFRGEHSEAASFYTEALQIYTENGNQTERGYAIWGLADVRRFQGEYSEASRLYSECLQIFTGIEHRRARALALFGLATVRRLHDEYSEAETLYSEALEIFTDVGERHGTASAVWSLAEVYRLRNDYSEATKRYSEALEIYTDIGDRQARGTALWGLAQVHLGQGEYKEALKLSSEATKIFTDVGDKFWRADALTSLAHAHRMQSHYNEAVSLYTEASRVLKEIGDPDRAAGALKNAEDIRKAAKEVDASSAEIAKVEEDLLLRVG
ncbi:hypothetical protein FRC01_009850 [Tulasnella sp. 417]|nr:hypothetical protein FRC01_009850 [Tulasnella sp. 417]